MAAFSSSKVYSLIDRLFYQPHHGNSHALAPGHSGLDAAMRQLRLDLALNGEQIDRSWLHRIELRSADRVIEFLERTEFPRRHGLLAALFVDRRCGIIATEYVGADPSDSINAVVRKILQLASFHHAHGIILALNDFSDAFHESRMCPELTKTLIRKGEAIDVFLLDHVVRTSGGWKSVFPRWAAGVQTCS